MASFSIDEDVAEVLALHLRALGHDVVTTTEAHFKGQSDPRQLWFATQSGRILLTSNRGDLTLLHETLLLWSSRWAAGAPVHAGILILPSGSASGATIMAALIDRLVRSMPDLSGRLLRWREARGWTDPLATDASQQYGASSP